MDLEKLKYSKCPNCKKHGIPAFRKIGRYRNYEVECKYCSQKYKVNPVLSGIMKFAAIILYVVLVKAVEKFFSFELPLWFAFVFLLTTMLILEYFTPLEEVDEGFPKYF